MNIREQETQRKRRPPETTQLRREIEEHNCRYHVLDDPVISDSEFDALMRSWSSGTAV